MITVTDILKAKPTSDNKDEREIEADKFHKICRICLLECEITNIFEMHFDGHFVSDLIFYCSSIQVIKNDEYPQNICADCINRLIISFEFIYKCCTSDELLRSSVQNEIIVKIEESQMNSVYNENLSASTVDIKLNELCGTLEYIDINTNFKDICNEVKSNGNVLEENKNENGLATPVNCQYLDESLTKLEDVKENRQLVHQPRNFVCTLCSKAFSYKDGLTQHKKTHTKEKPYQCELCLAKFSINRNLKRHIMIHTGEKPYSCDVCGKSFNQQVTLKGHKRTHTGERPYICNYCGKSLKYLSELKVHANRHFEEHEENDLLDDHEKYTMVKLECGICKEALHSKRALRLHNSITHSKKRNLCSICDKGFVGKQGLLSHMKTHTGEKPFSCQFCRKSFAHTMTLKDHELIHTGKKPHECRVCRKRFIQHHHLVHHMRTHTGEKPYTCPYCKKAFALKGNLTVHVRTHTGETPYCCTLCNMGFYDSSSLKKHNRSQHIK